ncbi:hypothetical protein GEU84_017245 [Fertoebacter nigrum]|uniref:Uncharacterized protein n=1 Tax=Fertoeibacter niger TaxID=2656921 RepID=A0A8X8H4D2_9RHOB|nr:hypothetical protein [Fertoeibacter niger]NUB46142.1 hypothetical protein [Fertoeibacter niger]
MAGDTSLGMALAAMAPADHKAQPAGGADPDHSHAAEHGKALGDVLAALRGSAPSGSRTEPRISDYLLGPMLFYAALTPDASAANMLPGVQGWCDLIRADAAGRAAEPANN